MKNSSLVRVGLGLFMAFALLLAGCGSGSTYQPLSPGRVIAFGDALSAVTATGEAAFSVRNTTTLETDSTVASRMAAKYGIKLVAATPGQAVTGSVSYANTAVAGANVGQERIADMDLQIQDFLAHNTVRSDDLFVITVGSLDIYDAANGTGNLTTATQALTTAIKRLTDAGARYVLYVMPVNMARTPWGQNPSGFVGTPAGVTSAAVQALSYDTGTACASFQCKAVTSLANAYPATSNGQPLLVADVQNYFNLVTGTTATGGANTFTAYGVLNPDVPVCTTANTVLPPVAGCTDANASTGTRAVYGLTSAYSWATSVFADNLFLTPLAHRVIADYIYGSLMFRAGWR